MTRCFVTAPGREKRGLTRVPGRFGSWRKETPAIRPSSRLQSCRPTAPAESQAPRFRRGARARTVFADNRTSVRRASLTASESGKTLATSGESATRFVLSAYRAAYLPRTPPEKSMSGTVATALVSFRILTPLARVCAPHADYTRYVAAVGVPN